MSVCQQLQSIGIEDTWRGVRMSTDPVETSSFETSSYEAFVRSQPMVTPLCLIMLPLPRHKHLSGQSVTVSPLKNFCP